MDKMEEEEEEEEVEEAGVPIPARFEVLSFLCAKLSPLQITPSVRYCFFNKNSDEENPFRLLLSSISRRQTVYSSVHLFRPSVCRYVSEKSFGDILLPLI